MSANRLAAIAVLILAVTAPVGADDKKKPAAADTYDAMLARYLEDARKLVAPTLESQWGWMNGLTGDQRARHTNDLVTIRVVENISGSGTADAATSKNGSANLGITNLFGLEHGIPAPADPTRLVGAKHDTEFKGAGSTTRAGELTAVMTARVADVLPNGYLVIEGVREIEINGERQVVVLTGVARPADVDARNVVLSTSMAQVRIRYFGRGLFQDNLKPGFLIRLLNKVF